MYKTKQITEEQAYAKLAAFCAAAEHCESELWKKLTQWGISTSASGDIIRRLLKENYINDIRYGNCFVRDKFKYNKWGRIKIKQALVQKGLSASVIEQSLEEIDEQAYEELLLDLLKKKSTLIKAGSDYECRCKLMRFGAGRGFEQGVISRCLSRLGCSDTDYFE